VWIQHLPAIVRVRRPRRSTGYLTNCQDVCKIEVLALVSTGLKPGLVTVNLESWHLTCSAPPAADGEALRQKANARGVPKLTVPILPISRDRSFSRKGTPARSRPSILLRAFPVSVHFEPIPVSERCTVVHHADALEMADRVVLRAFRQMMVGLRKYLPLRPPVFLFS